MCQCANVVCQPLLEMLVLWGNEQNGPIWTLNGATEGQRIAPFFFCQFLWIGCRTLWIWCSGTKISNQVPRLTWMRVGEPDNIYLLQRLTLIVCIHWPLNLLYLVYSIGWVDKKHGRKRSFDQRILPRCNAQEYNDAQQHRVDWVRAQVPIASIQAGMTNKTGAHALCQPIPYDA